MTAPRLLLLSGLLALGSGATVLLPSTAHALEQDGIHLATYNSIMKCDVDIRADISAGTQNSLASLQAAIRAIDVNLEGADRTTREKLESWREVLSGGVEALSANNGDKKVLSELQKKMGAVKMVVEAQTYLEAEAAQGQR